VTNKWREFEGVCWINLAHWSFGPVVVSLNNIFLLEKHKITLAKEPKF
jgi:hypothetical protein